MFSKSKTVCFSGHRSEKLPSGGLENLKLSLFNAVGDALNNGYDTFIFGGCYGFDLLSAETVLLHKLASTNSENKIRLIAAVPFRGQEEHWKSADKRLYHDIIKKCDDVVVLSERYNKGCYFNRNRFMVDNSILLICYFNGGKGGTGYTVDYALQQGVNVVNLFDMTAN